MGKQDRLCGLQVGEAGHQRIQVRFGLVQQGIDQQVKVGCDFDNFVTQVEPDIKRHLIVARTSGVQALARLADGGRETRFDIHVDVFQADGKIELARLYLAKNCTQPVDNLFNIVKRDDPLFAQHAGMGDGTANILRIEALVELNRCGELLDEGIGGLGKTTAPEFIFGHTFS